MVRALMRRLYQIYDNGGHSMGRSPRSSLLEAAMWRHSLPLPEILDDSHETFAKIRALVRVDEPIECVSVVLEELSQEMYTVLVVRALRECVRKMEHPSIVEENIVKTLFCLLSGERRLQMYQDKGGRRVSDHDLVREGRRRAEVLCEQERGPW